MSSEKTTVRWSDWNEVALVVAIFLLIALFGGEPDIQDSIVEAIKPQPTPQKTSESQ